MTITSQDFMLNSLLLQTVTLVLDYAHRIVDLFKHLILVLKHSTDRKSVEIFLLPDAACQVSRNIL